jgi:hypothetical protein
MNTVVKDFKTFRLHHQSLIGKMVSGEKEERTHFQFVSFLSWQYTSQKKSDVRKVG